MKKTILLSLMILLTAMGALAQQKKGNGDKAKEFLEFKLKFIADEMELKGDARQKFNETYSQMEQERRQLFKKSKEIEKRIKNSKNASEAEYDKANKELTEVKAKMADIEKKYDAKFSKFLTKKQLFKMKEAEEKFMEKVREYHAKKKDAKQL